MSTGTERAARGEAERLWPSGTSAAYVIESARALACSAFVAGATWQAARMPSVEQVAAREAVQRLIDRAVEVAADDTPLLVAVQDARAAVVALWGAL